MVLFVVEDKRKEVKIMKKKVIYWRGKKFYLLGKDKEGKKYWLQAPEWVCDWHEYWNCGCVDILSNNRNSELSREIDFYTHFNYLFLNNTTGFAIYSFDKFFVETTLNENEKYQLIDYMMSCYNLITTAEILHRGYSHQTEAAKIDVLKNEDFANCINKTLLPAIFERIDNLLGGERK